MAKEDSKKGSNDKKYQPKATVRHAKIAKSKIDEVEDQKLKMENERYYAKKNEAKRRKEIKELPKEERAEAKAKLKADIVKRKADEKIAKAKYLEMKANERKRQEMEEEEDDDVPVKPKKEKAKAAEKPKAEEKPKADDKPKEEGKKPSK